MIRKRAVLALIFILAGALLLMVSVSNAQDDPPVKEYAGADECSDCHRDLSRPHEESPHGLALIDADNEDFIIGDFGADEASRTVTFPDGESRPLEKDDVAFALGMGRYAQRYLYAIGENDYAVLPVEWNVAEQVWQPYGSAEEWATSPAQNFGQSCAGCHTTGYNVETAEWIDPAVQCEACHGPGNIHIAQADEAGNRANDEEIAAIRSAIVRSPDAQICGQCHSQGIEPTSNHPFPITYQPGGDLLADDTFVLASTDSTDHWWASGHAAQSNMQFNEWFNSAHASALTTLQNAEGAKDECLACHSADYRQTQRLIQQVEDGDRDGDPLTALTLETAQFGVTCTTCHNVHLEAEEDAPIVSYLAPDSTYALCVDCHSDADTTDGLHHPNQQMFEGVALVEEVAGIPSAHFTEENAPECITCHMSRVPAGDFELSSHLLKPITPGQTLDVEGLEDSCSECHSDVIEAQGMQGFMDDVQSNTETRLTAIQAALTADSPAWVNLVANFVAGDGSRGIHNPAYTDALLDAVETELGIETPRTNSQITPAPPTSNNTQSNDEDIPADELSTNAILIMGLAVLALIGAAWFFFSKKESTL